MFNHPVICKTLFRGGIRNEKYHFDLPARRNELFEEFVQLPKSEAALATGLALSCGFVPLEKYTKKKHKTFQFTKSDTALVKRLASPCLMSGLSDLEDKVAMI